MAFNIQAPDEGNINLLHKVANAQQKERWLRPLVAGDDPHRVLDDRARRRRRCRPVAAQDHRTRRRRRLRDQRPQVADHRRARRGIEHRDGAHDRRRAAPTSARRCSWCRSTRRASRSCACSTRIDAVSPGGHAVVDFHDVRVPASDVLGEIGQGFRNAQVRLGPARLTHCMRWLGAARRAHDVAVDYARRRHAFGKLIGEHEGRRLHAGRQRDGPAALPARGLARRLAARPGPARAHRDQPVQGVLLRGAEPRGRPLAAGARRPGHHRPTRWCSASTARSGRSASTTARRRCTGSRSRGASSARER